MQKPPYLLKIGLVGVRFPCAQLRARICSARQTILIIMATSIFGVTFRSQRFFFCAIAPQYRGKSRYRKFFRSNSKSSVPGKIPVQGFFAQTQSLQHRENPSTGIFRSNSKSLQHREKSQYRKFFAPTHSLQYRGKSSYKDFFVQTRSLQDQKDFSVKAKVSNIGKNPNTGTWNFSLKLRVSLQYREIFRLNSKSPVPVEFPVRGNFAQTQTLQYRENIVKSQSLQYRENVVRHFWESVKRIVTLEMRKKYVENGSCYRGRSKGPPIHEDGTLCLRYATEF